MRRALGLVCLFGLTAFAWPPSNPLGPREIDLRAPETPIPANYLGINIIRYKYTEPMPPKTIASWRVFDTAWYKVEPQAGRWKFGHPDKTVADAAAQGGNVDFVLTGSPTWAASRPNESAIRSYLPKGMRSEPANLNQWANYVRTVATRYKGKVHIYELWNEPNLTSQYTGDVNHLVSMCQIAYRVLKQVDPDITVISPGFSPYQNQAFVSAFLTEGGRGTFDVFGYHFYTETSIPEKEVVLFEKLSAMLVDAGTSDVQIWNTESGYLIESIPAARHQNASEMPSYAHHLSVREAQDFLVRAYVLGWALHIRRFYWFCWGDNRYAVVDDGGTTWTPVATAFTRLAGYLTGSRMLSCRRSSDGDWFTRFEGKTGRHFEIVWSDSGAHSAMIPPAWDVSRAEDVMGKPVAVSSRIQIDGRPLFLF